MISKDPNKTFFVVRVDLKEEKNQISSALCFMHLSFLLSSFSLEKGGLLQTTAEFLTDL